MITDELKRKADRLLDASSSGGIAKSAGGRRADQLIIAETLLATALIVGYGPRCQLRTNSRIYTAATTAASAMTKHARTRWSNWCVD